MSFETNLWFYDNSGVITGKLLSIHNTNRKYFILGDIITIAPQKYKLGKKHLKKKRTLFSAIIIGLCKWSYRLNGLSLKFKYNKALLLNLTGKFGKFLGTRVYSFLIYESKLNLDPYLYKKLVLLSTTVI